MSFRNKKTYDPAEEAKKDYIAYNESELYAKTDIPLHPGKGVGYLTPKQVWEDFDPKFEPLDTVVSSENRQYVFTAKKYGEGALRVETDVFLPSYPSHRPVIIVGEYGMPYQMEIVEELVKDGFAVFVPDYCGEKEDTHTEFPSCVSYGKAGWGGEHLNHVFPSAKETVNYLYSLIIRRTITFIEEVFSMQKPILIGIRNGVEYAMQTAGCDERVRAVGCLGGAGYSEFLSMPFFIPAHMTLSPEQVAWMTGVSGVSYLIGKNIPLFVSIGSNDTFSDPDRLLPLSQVVGKKNLRACICNGYCDNVDTTGFLSLKKWLRLTFLDASLPDMPTVSVRVSNDGVVYADVRADARSPIRATTVYYAFDEYNHETRNWIQAPCETVGKGEYLSRLTVPHEDATLFLYADVVYETGAKLSSFILHTDFTDVRLAVESRSSEFIIYSYGDPKSNFKENNDEPVLFRDNIGKCTIPLGLDGSVNREGQMIIFIGDTTKNVDKDKVLQVDCYSEEKTFDLVICLTDDKGTKYYAQKNVYTDISFEAAMFSVNDFKDKRYRPLSAWATVKRLTICSKNIVIGKLMFV